jgi:hypothetical protein
MEWQELAQDGLAALRGEVQAAAPTAHVHRADHLGVLIACLLRTP